MAVANAEERRLTVSGRVRGSRRRWRWEERRRLKELFPEPSRWRWEKCRGSGVGVVVMVW